MSQLLKAFSLVPTMMFACLFALHGWIQFPLLMRNKVVGILGALYILVLGMRYVCEQRREEA